MVSSAKYQQINEKRYPVTEYRIRFPSQESNREENIIVHKNVPNMCPNIYIVKI